MLKDVGFSLSFLLNEKEKKPFFCINNDVEDKEKFKKWKMFKFFFFSLKF